MFRKPTKKRPVQTRPQISDGLSDEEQGSSTQIVKESIKRKRRDNPMRQSTKKRADNTGQSSSSGSEDDTVVAEHAFAPTGEAAPLGPKDQGATATLEIDTDYAADAQAQFERVQNQLKEGLEKDGKLLYKGQAMYGAKQAKDTAKGNASSGLNRIGPVRAPQFLRQTVRWDFAPDICKDYKETGFCTFGDSCKFLHDRSDYKHGWEIERDHASGRLNQVDDTNYEINDDDDDLPDECFICCNPFVDPVVTRCKHYFCMKCAMNSFRKSKKCPICNQSTGGIFNVAKDLVLKMAGQSKRGAEVKEESESSDDDVKEELGEGPSEEHHHAEGDACDHSHPVVKMETSENGSEVGEEIVNEEVEIKMEEIESDEEAQTDEDGESNDDEETETGREST